MPPEAKPLICYVTDRHGLPPGSAELSDEARLLETIERAAAGGVDWIQIREKDLPARDLRELVVRAIQAASSRSRILVNDRLDIALAAGAAGVHLGGASLPVAEVTRWCRTGHAPAQFLVGASCHSLDQARAAERDGASYMFFGPVFATPSKLAYGPAQGLARLTEICRSARIPVLAIGGVTAENPSGCFQAGAAGIAAIRLFQQAQDVAAVMARLRSVWKAP